MNRKAQVKILKLRVLLRAKFNKTKILESGLAKYVQAKNALKSKIFRTEIC